MPQQFRSGVFISYSHADREWIDRLRVFLAPHLRGEQLAAWDDTQIQAGSNWREEIERAIARARVAVLLVSPNFLASDFIANVELPLILQEVDRGLTILWIAVRFSAYQRTPLSQLQAANDPSRPLDALSRPEQDRALVEVAERIATAADVNAFANTFRIIDDFAPQLKAFVQGQPEPQLPAPHAVVARQQQEKIVFQAAPGVGPLDVITADDLKKLDPHAQKLIRAYERTMKELFDQWVELKPKRVAGDPETRQQAVLESDGVRQQLCAELTQLLDFVTLMGKSLEDHYQHIRFICRQ